MKKILILILFPVLLLSCGKKEPIKNTPKYYVWSQTEVDSFNAQTRRMNPQARHYYRIHEFDGTRVKEYYENGSTFIMTDVDW